MGFEFQYCEISEVDSQQFLISININESRSSNIQRISAVQQACTLPRIESIIVIRLNSRICGKTIKI